MNHFDIALPAAMPRASRPGNPAIGVRYAANPTAVTVCALLPELLEARLRRVKPEAHCCAAPGDLQAAIEQYRPHLVIADPSGCHDDGTRPLIEIRQKSPGMFMAAYCSLSAAVVPHLVSLAAHGITEVLIAGVDDTAERFRRLFAQAAARQVAELMIAALAIDASSVPPPLFQAIAEVYRHPERFRTTADLASAALVSRRGLYKLLRGAGIRSPRALLVSARVVRAIAMIHGDSSTIRRAAAECGFHRPEDLSAKVSMFTSRRPSELRSVNDLTPVLRILADRVRAL